MVLVEIIIIWCFCKLLADLIVGLVDAISNLIVKIIKAVKGISDEEEIYSLKLKVKKLEWKIDDIQEDSKV